MKGAFAKRLLEWNQTGNTRSMPWKGEKDPYRIWLSEIILQQTRVEQGRAYYERFLKAFPTIHRLASASPKKVFKFWEGLGYYNRCKNLLQTAETISKEHNGKFPSSYTELLKLKGVGPYTASAIASFAFNLPHAVVDGNVERVLSRYFGESTPVDATNGKNFYTRLANNLLDKKQPGLYNQAIMDFGAVICKPQNPDCFHCVQNKHCIAFKQKRIDDFPVKKKAVEKKNRWFCYFIISLNGRVYIRRRTEKDIWSNLYEFILLETNQLTRVEALMQSGLAKNIFEKRQRTVAKASEIQKQLLTHQTIYTRFITVRVKNEIPALADYLLVNEKEIERYPFPKSIAEYIRQKQVF
jgi:A/G-specific adenine glycosylase